jgi:flavin-dependent dehydrogenase
LIGASGRFDGAAAVDLLVIGGGPAGLATAIRARLAGLSVRVLERSRAPIDKACGEGLMPDAVMRLGELGVELVPAECRRFRGIRYLDGEVVAEGLFPRAGGLGVRRLHLHQALARRAAELGVELCWGVAATGLAPAAAGAGTGPGPAGTTVLGAFTDRAGLEMAAARWVVGADGLHSRVRRWAGLAGRPARLRRFGVRRHFACRPWSDMVEVYWGPRCEAYVTPVGSEEVGVALLWSALPGVSRQATAATDLPGVPRQAAAAADPREALATPTTPPPAWTGAPADLPGVPAISEEPMAGAAAEGKVSFDRLLAHFPALAARLAGARPASRDRGAGPLLQRAGAVCRGNVALVGDASGYVDAITGEGLAVAFHQAAALVEALRPPERSSVAERCSVAEWPSEAERPTSAKLVEAEVPGLPELRSTCSTSEGGDLARYAAAHRRIGRLPGNITALMLAIERRPWLRRRVVRALAADPALFSRLLGIHARALPPGELGIDGALRLVYRLVTARRS